MEQPRSYRIHSAQLFRLGLPLIASNLTGFAIHMSDTVMLGWYSVEALAAGVLGASFWFVIFIFGSGFGQAVMPVVASAEASGQSTQVRRVTRMAMWLSILFGLLVMPLFIWAAPILDLLDQPEEVAVLAGDYLVIAGLGMIPGLLFQVLRSYLSALERASVVFWVALATLVANICINYALIFGNFGAPELGIKGAAIASVTVQVLSILACVIYAVIVTPEHALLQRFWRPDWAAFRNVFHLGWPIGVTALSEVGLFNVSTVMMGWFGTVPLAAHGIALQIAAIFFLFHMGLAQAATIRVGQNWGRGDREGVRRVTISSNLMSGAFVCVAIAAYLLVGDRMIALFLNPDDPVREEVIRSGTVLLYVAAAFQLADAGQVQALSILRGMHDTRVPMVMAAVSYWAIGLPAAYALGFTFGLGGVGVWSGLTLALTCAWVLMGVRVWKRAFAERQVQVI